jgi:hypothetical protein
MDGEARYLTHLQTKHTPASHKVGFIALPLCIHEGYDCYLHDFGLVAFRLCYSFPACGFLFGCHSFLPLSVNQTSIRHHGLPIRCGVVFEPSEEVQVRIIPLVSFDLYL